MIGGFLRTTSCLAMVAAAGVVMGSVSAKAADLGGNCCADLEERVAELEATTVRKGNRKVSLQIYGQVSEAVIFWNDGAETNTYVQENNTVQNRLGFTGSAKINSDWSAGFKLELQIRAYRSSNANQLSLGASNNVQIPAYNTLSVALREANWFLKSNTYGTITVGRTVDSTVGTGSISLVNPDGFAGAAGPGFANGGFFLRRAGTTGNTGLSQRTWQTSAWINNGDGPLPYDYAATKGQVKYTSPFFLGQTKSSGFLFSADWGADDAWGVALRYVEDFGAIRVAAGVGYAGYTSPDRGFCSVGRAGNQFANGANPAFGSTNPAAELGSTGDCHALQSSASILHTPTGLYVSGGWSNLDDKLAGEAMLARTNGFQSGKTSTTGHWWIQGGWQAKLNPLGNTIFWGQYVDVKSGVNHTNGQIGTIAGTDVINSLGVTAIQRSAHTTAWGLGISQNIDAAAMVLYAGFHNISTDITLGAQASAARAKSNPIDDMQVFYTGATIKF